ncbi:hypothetical protein FKR81_15275 [Lentzea tibetensis]|uniref:Uncharacterized protein n=1 Tax=Lentzea tibetensis TaxID=2591470 RepID=A0A563EWQ1_9PSEU|nr:hypothetical protein [Lentzea tibetensis]TWP51554.1 hypothetical protein FKR81_15275 [Lentzea tibetensis]
MPIWLSAVIPAFAALAGASIGFFASVLGHQMTLRAAVKRDERSSASRLRDERKEAVLRYLSQARELERLAERRWHGDKIDDDYCSEQTSQMWYADAELLVLCSRDVHDRALALTEMITDLAWNRRDEQPWTVLAPVKHRALLAARRELGLAAPASS